MVASFSNRSDWSEGIQESNTNNEIIILEFNREAKNTMDLYEADASSKICVGLSFSYFKFMRHNVAVTSHLLCWHSTVVYSYWQVSNKQIEIQYL